MIEVTDLRKVYQTSDREITALSGINFQVDKGEIRGIVGPSGAGKSTLIRCLTGLERPTSGSLKIGGQEITTLSEVELRLQRRKLGMVFQDVNLFDSRTAAENIAYPLKIAKASKTYQQQRVAELLELVGLEDRGGSYPAQLSGGQRQRIGIARALAAQPEVLLCDEPTSALDWTTTRQILELIGEVRDKLQLTVLIITHEMSVVRQVCDSVSRIEAGLITESGTLLDIVNEGTSTLASELIPLASAPIGAQRAQLEITYSSAITPTSQVLIALGRLGDDIKISGGTIETLAESRVGRFHVDVDNANRDAVIQSLTASGLRVSQL